MRTLQMEKLACRSDLVTQIKKVGCPHGGTPNLHKPTFAPFYEYRQSRKKMEDAVRKKEFPNFSSSRVFFSAASKFL